jgi:hypothetical protein
MAKPPSSANNLAVISRGMMVPGDLIGLHPTLRLEDHLLVDRVNDSRHRISPEAVAALHALVVPVPAGEWARAAQAQLSPSQVAQLIQTLNDLGALTLRRRWPDHIWAQWRWWGLWRLGLHPTVLVRRREVNLQSLAAASGRSLVSTWVALAAAVALWSPLYPHSLQLGLTAAVSLWLSVMAHEAAHVWPLRHLRPVLLQGGWRLGLLHRRTERRRELISAASGPLAGALVCLITLPLPWALAGMLLHLASLSPQTADGRTVWTRLLEVRA